MTPTRLEVRCGRMTCAQYRSHIHFWQLPSGIKPNKKASLGCWLQIKTAIRSNMKHDVCDALIAPQLDGIKKNRTYMQSCRAIMKSPKNSCKSLTAPCLHLLDHFVKRLPGINDILTAEDVHFFSTSFLPQTCEAETDLATRMLQKMNAERAVDCKPKFIK